MFIFSVFIIILVEGNVKGILWKCAKKTSIYGQDHKVANSERYWTCLTKEKDNKVIYLQIKFFFLYLMNIK